MIFWKYITNIQNIKHFGILKINIEYISRYIMISIKEPCMHISFIFIQMLVRFVAVDIQMLSFIMNQADISVPFLTQLHSLSHYVSVFQRIPNYLSVKKGAVFHMQNYFKLFFMLFYRLLKGWFYASIEDSLKRTRFYLRTNFAFLKIFFKNKRNILNWIIYARNSFWQNKSSFGLSGYSAYFWD